MTTERIRANGLDFAYLVEGRGPLVMLLHGFPDTAHTWDRTMTELARAGYRAVAPFMRGYHPTEIPKAGPFDIDTLGRDVLALVEAFGEANAVVVGHDWGAAAAYAAAALGPERVRLLVTLAIPHPSGIPRTPRQVWNMRHFLKLRRASIAAKLRADDLRYIDELWHRWSPKWTDLPASETAAVKAAFAEPGSLEAACAYYAAIPLSATPPASAKLPIKMPAVAFVGADDHQMRLSMFEKARPCFESSYEVIEVPGGHFMHREHPDRVIGELVRVVKEHG
ncbi:MAG: alpha/beta hydrolase [Kofleriaceae bacterium]